MKVRCAVCGKETKGRATSRKGYSDTDGSERFPRKHVNAEGIPCLGYNEFAEWPGESKLDVYDLSTLATR